LYSCILIAEKTGGLHAQINFSAQYIAAAQIIAIVKLAQQIVFLPRFCQKYLLQQHAQCLLAIIQCALKHNVPTAEI
jgi:hypothetical protein